MTRIAYQGQSFPLALKSYSAESANLRKIHRVWHPVLCDGWPRSQLRRASAVGCCGGAGAISYTRFFIMMKLLTPPCLVVAPLVTSSPSSRFYLELRL